MFTGYRFYYRGLRSIGTAQVSIEVGGGESMRVLLVEDEDLLRGVVAEELREAGLEVVEATNGAEAQRAIHDARFDVLVADIRLPGHLNGWQVAEYCREIRPSLPVIYVSGLTTDGRQDVPGSIHLRKPFRLRDLLDVVARVTMSGPPS